LFGYICHARPYSGSSGCRCDRQHQRPADGSIERPGRKQYHRLITDIGQQVSVKQIHQDNIETIAQSLANQQTEISGVNINDEAAQMLIFEQMFKAMAKYLSTIQSSLSTIMEII
jgi:hypothetical protein